MKSTSVKSYGTQFIDALAVAETATPYDIVAAMEANFMRPQVTPISRLYIKQALARIPITEVVANDPVMSTMAEEIAAFRERRKLANAKWQRDLMIWRNFGRPSWLPKDELGIVTSAGAELESVEDKLAAGYYAVEKLRSRRAWKREQAKAQDPDNYRDLCLTYDLPPATKRRSHQPAYYSITGPSGVTIDLGKPFNGYAPILSKNPNEAFRRFIARLGVTMKGGEVEILNRLLKAPQIEYTDAQGNVSKEWKWLPSYTTTHCGAWFVTVGWRLNPKVASSRYWVDADGELTQENPNVGLMPGDDGYEAPLTLSQLDYHLLCDSKDLAIEDESGEVIEFMNEEEEFLSMFGDREESGTFINFDDFVAGEAEGDFDDAELRLLKECSYNVDRSESGITMGDLQSQTFIRHIQGQIEEAENDLADCFADDSPEAVDACRRIAKYKRLDEEWDRFIGVQHDDALIRYWYPNATNRMMTMGVDFDSLKEQPKSIAGASLSPANTIEPELTAERAEMPDHRVVSFTWSNALSPRLVAKREQEARKGSVLRSVESNTLAAELAFAAEFERRLGIR